MTISLFIGIILVVLGLLLFWWVIKESKVPNTMPGTSGKMGASILIMLVAIALIALGMLTNVITGIVWLFQ